MRTNEKKDPKGFTLAAVCFAFSTVGFAVGKQFAAAAAMGGMTFLYAALAYRAFAAAKRVE